MVTDPDGGVNSAASNLEDEAVLQTVQVNSTESQGESRMVCFSCLLYLFFLIFAGLVIRPYCAETSY